MAAGGVLSTTRRTSAISSGLVVECAGPRQLGPHHLGHAAAAPLGDVFGHFETAGAGFLGIGDGTCVALDECSQPARRTSAQTARRCSRPSKSRQARSVRRCSVRRGTLPVRRRIAPSRCRACGSTEPSGDWPKPRRSGAMTRASGASASICAFHIVWSSGKPWTRSTGGAVAAVDVGESRRGRVRTVFMDEGSRLARAILTGVLSRLLILTLLRCSAASRLLLGQRLFEQGKLAVHDLHVIDLREGLPLVFHRVFVVTDGVVAAAKRIEIARLARFAVRIQLQRAVRVANRLLKIAFGVADEPGPLVVGRGVGRGSRRFPVGTAASAC